MAHARSLQRKVKRIIEIETFAQSNLLHESIERVKANIKLLNEEWEDYKSKEELYGELPEIVALQEQFEAKYFTTKSILVQTELEKDKPTQHVDLDASLHELMTNQRSFLHDISNLANKGDGDVRLPRINVPYFTGIYSEFASFRDLFEASINNNPKLSKVHKFQYLKGLLRGEAAALVRHIAVTDANYEEAWQMIVKRYDKKKQVINMLLKQYMDQPSITQPSAKSLHHMRDTSDEVMRGIKVLGDQAQSRDPWLIYILVNKLDIITKQAWARHSYEIEFPSIQQFFDFLNKQSDTLESCEPTKRPSHRQTSNAIMKAMQTNIEDVCCIKCDKNHYLRNCDDFLELPINERRGFVAENKLCFICLLKNHQSQNCRSRYRCSICKARHHTTLHQDDPRRSLRTTTTPTDVTSSGSISTNQTDDSINVAHALSTKKVTAILPTAEIRVLDSSNQLQRCRVLLDSGAQASFISESCAKRLALPRKNAKLIIKGLTAGTETTRGKMSIKAFSLYSINENIDVEVLILNKLTNYLPSLEIDITNIPKINQLQLADPHFHKPECVDIIIGADRFFNILREGRLANLGENKLVAQNSMFGWILSGEATHLEETSNAAKVNYHIELNVDDALRRFWEIEEFTSNNPVSLPENECEEHFKANVRRHVNGKYIVKLPFKTNRVRLGNSINVARKRFFNLEQKFSRDTKFKSEYVKVINEYINLGHMREAQIRSETENSEIYYLPHHAVTKNESLTTKLRVVFDGSSKTTNGQSINDQLMIGPTIQPTLWTILLQFRNKKIAFTADIEKMYRQVLIAEEDQQFQRVLWRENKYENLKHYELTTVTFGMASSAFLAIRCLKQTAVDFEKEYPLISNEIHNKFYVDDYLSGANTIEEAQYLKAQLQSILAQRGFHLRKWRSNEGDLSDDHFERTDGMVAINEANPTIKILGLQWSSQDDQLAFRVDLPFATTSTKRTLISDASKIFDPLGLVSPSIIIAKILFQKLWLQKLDWDDELPHDIALVWNQLKLEFPQLEKAKINRFISLQEIELHGFSDASERAYAAVIYGRFKNESGGIQTELLVAKTKVAPIAQISLPRLELCGAHLLAKLMTAVKGAIQRDVPVYVWTDSNIVLSWLSDHPINWKTFVANRVSEIQRLIPRNHWQHVRSESNPADYASRGVLPSKLLSLEQWWHGPTWLSKPKPLWPTNKHTVFYGDTICERKEKPLSLPVFHTHHSNEQGEIVEAVLNKTFSFSKAIRILCFVSRFIENTRNPKNKLQGSITLEESQAATEKIIKWVQHTAFSREIQKLTKNRQLNNNDKLSTLTPYLDAKGLLRVGGRLNNSRCTDEIKHPIILPKAHLLSRMIISHIHIKYLHPGPSLTFHLIRQTYWIVNGRALVRDQIRKCIQCFKNRATASKQLMGSLPSVRVTPARPFSNCGIDYAGPIMLASKKGRGAKMTKGYIALFVCMVTKAIHLEPVTELTTDAFLAALKRFSARRNVPSHIYSDNGTNFVGANRRLKEVYQFNNFKNNQSVISDYCTENQINWHHIPPSAPHFGGLWESAIKSVKTQLNRVTGNCHLTFEEMATLLCQIEGILNSRPLGPIADDDTSFNALTPAHFLMGSSVAAVPEYNLEDTAPSRLSRWQQVEQRAQSFWKRFHKEYLNSLQQRYKWKSKEENVKIGDLVLIKEDNLPCCKWAMGRIIAIYPDNSGLIRVVTIKTAVNTVKRPITKVCKLPLE